LKQRFYRAPLRFACLKLADRIVGISNHTLDTFLAGRKRRLDRDIVHYYGVDPEPFLNAPADRLGFRRQLGYADDALVLLFGGRLVSEKNPVFAVDVLASLRKVEHRAVGVFAGTGSQEPAIVARAQELGVMNAVRMLGWRRDLAEIMSCSDWFILPHPEYPMEGFGLAIVEAQLAGLPMLLSNGIPNDPLLRTASYCRLPLSASPTIWANAAVELLRNPVSSRAEAATALGNSPFAMDVALADLMSLHGNNIESEEISTRNQC
jgi:glycosyltransferase involved in cell wall biosynthesis